MLLDNVSSNTTSQPAQFCSSTDIAACYQHLADCRTLSTQSTNRRRKHFSDLNCKEYYIFIIFGCYIQLTGEYDIIGKTKSIINKNKE